MTDFLGPGDAGGRRGNWSRLEELRILRCQKEEYQVAFRGHMTCGCDVWLGTYVNIYIYYIYIYYKYDLCPRRNFTFVEPFFEDEAIGFAVPGPTKCTRKRVRAFSKEIDRDFFATVCITWQGMRQI